MNQLAKLIDFLEHLESGGIFYRLSKMRDAIMVEVAVPGQRWEVEFFADGTIEREVFDSTNDVGELDLAEAKRLASQWIDLRKDLESEP